MPFDWTLNGERYQLKQKKKPIVASFNPNNVLQRVLRGLIDQAARAE